MRISIVLATLTSVAAQFCPNYLGAMKSLLAPVEGSGKLTIGSTPVRDVAIENAMIITTNMDGDGKPYMKEIACIYAVEVKFATSGVELITGPPNAKNNEKLCWKLMKEENAMTFTIHDATTEGKCPGVGDVGTVAAISDFKDTIPDALRVTCQADVKELEGLSIVSNSYWAAPAYAAFTTMNNDGAWVLLQYCLHHVDTEKATDKLVVDSAAGTFTTNFYTASADGSLTCRRVTINPSAGVIQQSNCLPGADISTFSVAIKSLPKVFSDIVASFAATPAATTSVDQLKEAKRDVVTTTLTLAGINDDWSISSALKPCNAFVLRLALAKGAGVSVDDIKLTMFEFKTTSLSIAMDSPANLIAEACVAKKARMLRVSPAILYGRALATAPATAAVTVVAPSAAGAATINSQLTAFQANPAQMNSMAASFGTAAGITTTPTATGSAPATGTAVVIAKPALFVRAGVYKPGEEIKMFHAIPRQGQNGRVTNEFSTSTDYLSGAIAPAAIIVALGVLAFVIYVLVYFFIFCCKCCCVRCRKPRDPDTYFQGCKKFAPAPRVLVVMALLNVALLLSGIAYLPRFGLGIDQLFSAMNDVSDILKTSGGLMSSTTPVSFNDPSATTPPVLMPSLGQGCADASTSAGKLYVQLTDPALALSNGNAATPETLKNMVSALEKATGLASTAAFEVGKLLLDSGSQVSDILVKLPIGTIKQTVSMAGMAIFAILSALILMWSLLVCKNSFAACLYKVSSPIILILVLLVSILAGVYYAVGIIGADVCFAPDKTLMTALNITGIEGEVYDTMNFYINCGTNQPMKEAGAYKLVSDNLGMVNLAVSQVQNLYDQANVDRNDASFKAMWNPDATLLPTMRNGLVDGEKAVLAITEKMISCQPIDAVMNKVYEGLCNNGFGTIIALCRIIIAAAVLLMIQLGVGADVCCWHPGDATMWVKDGEMKSGDLVTRAPEIIGVAKGAPVKGSAPALGGSHV